jgi:hypothetical protein
MRMVVLWKSIRVVYFLSWATARQWGSVCSHQDLIKAKCGKFASFHFFCANRKQCLQKELEFYTVLFMQSKPVKDDGFDIFSDPT